MRDFVTVATFEYAAEADMVKFLLEQDGIEVNLEDASMVALDPLLSAAIGGIKLQVPAKQVKLAAAFLEMRAAVKKKKKAMPEVTFDCDECGKSMTFPGARRGGVEDCPHCHCYVDVPD